MTDVTIEKTVNEVTVTEDAVTVEPVTETTEVTVNPGISDHGALSGLTDNDHTQYLLKAGGTMTGDLTLAGDPDAALKAATKQYVDAQAGATNLDDLSDVSVPTPTDAQVLTWVDANGQWEAADAAGGGASALDDLSDVTISSPVDGHALTYNGSAWVNQDRYVQLAGDTIPGDITFTGVLSARGTISAAVQGVTRLDAGVAGGTPRFILEQSGNGTWVIDNEDGVFRWNRTGSFKLQLEDEGSDGTALRIYHKNAVAAEINTESSNVLTNETGSTGGIQDTLVLRHNADISPGTGFGTALLLQIKSSTTEDVDAGRVYTKWNVATHASREADLVLTAFEQATEREGLRIRGSGSGAQIGFLGAAPQAAPTYTPTNVSTDRSYDADTANVNEVADVLGTLIADLQAFGLLA